MKDGWVKKKLGEVCTRITDGSHNPPKGIDFSEYLMLSSQNINNRTISYDKVRYLSQENFIKEDSRTRVKEGDVLLTIVGTIGRSCVVRNNNKQMTFQRSVAILTPSEDVYSEFLMYQFFFLYNKINNEANGAAQKGIYLKQLKNFEILLTSNSNQHRIVEKLDAGFAKIEQIKANAEKNLQQAKDLFQATLREVFLPKYDWERKLISQICENLDSKRVPITKCDRKSGDYPYYGASGIVDYVNEYIFDEDLLLVSEDGANLRARVTPIAFSVSGKIWVNNHAHVLKFGNIALQRFIEYYFAQLNIDQYVTGMAQPKFNQKSLNNVLVCLPTNKIEQQRIVDKLDKLSEICKKLEDNYNRILTECDALKQALLRKAFNGEL